MILSQNLTQLSLFLLGQNFPLSVVSTTKKYENETGKIACAC